MWLKEKKILLMILISIDQKMTIISRLQAPMLLLLLKGMCDYITIRYAIIFLLLLIIY